MKALAFRLRPRVRFPKLGIAPQLVAIALVLALIVGMAIEPTRQLIEQQQRIEGMEGELNRVERSNERLEARIGRLNDPDFLEQRAREQIGLVRPGETTYLVLPPGRGTRAAKLKARAEASAPVPAIPEPGFLEGLLDFIGL